MHDDQWERIRQHFPEEHTPDSRPGRKPIPTRVTLEAVLGILNNGAQWQFLPQYYADYKTVHRRFQQWYQREVIREVLTHLANTPREEGLIDERESFINATFATAKDGGEAVGLTKCSKGLKILEIVDRHGLPLSVSTHAANHHEATLVQLSFDFYMSGGQARTSHWRSTADSDGLDDELKQDSVNTLAPPPSTRKLRLRMDGTYAAMNAGGSSNASLPGSNGNDAPYSLGVLRHKLSQLCPASPVLRCS